MSFIFKIYSVLGVSQKVLSLLKRISLTLTTSGALLTIQILFTQYVACTLSTNRKMCSPKWQLYLRVKKVLTSSYLLLYECSMENVLMPSIVLGREFSRK